jgi:TonB-linked SusC/RagA family outer membrane protein
VGFGSVELKATDIVRTNEISISPLLNTLDDVVVVGYGTQRARNVTGAMGRIGAREIKQVAVVGLDQALQGRIAGVQVAENSAEPGADVSIRIRGVASITRGSEPLVVVDGIPMSVKLNAINPNDIETIDVLKDASSAAIYGSRGSAGVILVTTKRGKAGKVRVTLDAYTARQTVTKHLDLLDGPQFAKVANENLVNGGQTPNPEWMNPATVANTDWQDAIFRTAPMNNYNIAISGGSEKSRNYLSFGYTSQDGVLSNNATYKRFTGRFNSDYEISSRFKVGVNVNYNTDKKSGIRTQDDNTGTIISILQAHPTDPLYSTTDGPVANTTLYGFEGYSFRTKQNLYYAGIGNNPVYVANKHFFSRGNGTQLLTNAFGELEIIKGLKLKSLIGYTVENNFGKSGANKVPSVVSAGGGGLNDRTSVGSNFSQATQWNWVNTLSYARTFGKHNLSSVIGSDALKFTGSFLNVSGFGAPQNQNSITASADLTGRPSGSEFVPSTLVSYFARVMYDFDDRFLVSGTFRRDGSSKFGPKHTWGNFPSVSAGWRISEENFMKSVSVVDDLKIRASYGAVGNQNIPNLQYYSQYSNAGGNYAYTLNGVLVPGLRPTVLGNDSIHWERNVEKNIGLDASFLKGKITLSADVYKKELKDLLGDVPVPYFAAPFSGQLLKNAFSMESSGIELTLGVNQKVGEVNLSFNANFSTLENKVTSLIPGDEKSYVFQNISAIGDMKATTRSQLGERIGNFWGFVTDGIIQNAAEADVYKAMGFKFAEPGDRKYKDINKDGKLNDDDRTIIGNGLPGYLYGLNARAEYKGFDINAFFNGQGDADIANLTRYFTSSVNFRNPGLVNASTDVLKAWKGEGTSNEFPRNSSKSIQSNRWFSDAYIEDGSFFRLRNLQIGYTLPTRIMGKIGASSARVYVAGQNLFTITNYSGYDPEVGNNTGTGGSGIRIAGIDYGRYPTAKMFTVGFTAQF